MNNHEIIDLQDASVSDRNGSYGGQAGSKEGIFYNNEYWMLKYPKNTKTMRNVGISYTTAPLSEYLGSQIYHILGYDVHETILGYRNRKLVVGCKDFCAANERLFEYRSIKNIYNERIEEYEQSSESSSNHNSADLKEIIINLESNPILKDISMAKGRFWDCAVIDVLINNNDRNNGNWGVIKNGNTYRMAPIFDNGAAFSNKLSIGKMEQLLYDNRAFQQNINAAKTAYVFNGKELWASQLLVLDIPDLKNSIKKIYLRYNEKREKIRSFINDIPEQYGEIMVCSSIQKEFLLKTMDARMEFLIKPVYEMQCHERKKEMREEYEF